MFYYINNLGKISDMWCLLFVGVLTILLIMVTFGPKSQRKLLANRIPGPKGMYLIGMLPICLQGPEKILKNAFKMYRE